jgi:hypothetical protein
MHCTLPILKERLFPAAGKCVSLFLAKFYQNTYLSKLKSKICYNLYLKKKKIFFFQSIKSG